MNREFTIHCLTPTMVIINGRDIVADSGPVLLAEPIRASDGAHVWVQPYDDLTDGRRLGREISRNVARVLQLGQTDAPR